MRYKFHNMDAIKTSRSIPIWLIKESKDLKFNPTLHKTKRKGYNILLIWYRISKLKI